MDEQSSVSGVDHKSDSDSVLSESSVPSLDQNSNGGNSEASNLKTRRWSESETQQFFTALKIHLSTRKLVEWNVLIASLPPVLRRFTKTGLKWKYQYIKLKLGTDCFHQSENCPSSDVLDALKKRNNSTSLWTDDLKRMFKNAIRSHLLDSGAQRVQWSALIEESPAEIRSFTPYVLKEKYRTMKAAGVEFHNHPPSPGWKVRRKTPKTKVISGPNKSSALKSSEPVVSVSGSSRSASPSQAPASQPHASQSNSSQPAAAKSNSSKRTLSQAVSSQSASSKSTNVQSRKSESNVSKSITSQLVVSHPVTSQLVASQLATSQPVACHSATAPPAISRQFGLKPNRPSDILASLQVTASKNSVSVRNSSETDISDHPSTSKSVEASQNEDVLWTDDLNESLLELHRLNPGKPLYWVRFQLLSKFPSIDTNNFSTADIQSQLELLGSEGRVRTSSRWTEHQKRIFTNSVRSHLLDSGDTRVNWAALIKEVPIEIRMFPKSSLQWKYQNMKTAGVEFVNRPPSPGWKVRHNVLKISAEPVVSSPAMSQSAVSPPAPARFDTSQSIMSRSLASQTAVDKSSDSVISKLVKSKPISSRLSRSKPTASKLTISKSATSKPSTFKQTVSTQTTSKSTACKLTASEPTASKPTTSQSVISQSQGTSQLDTSKSLCSSGSMFPDLSVYFPQIPTLMGSASESDPSEMSSCSNSSSVPSSTAVPLSLKGIHNEDNILWTSGLNESLLELRRLNPEKPLSWLCDQMLPKFPSGLNKLSTTGILSQLEVLQSQGRMRKYYKWTERQKNDLVTLRNHHMNLELPWPVTVDALVKKHPSLRGVSKGACIYQKSTHQKLQKNQIGATKTPGVTSDPQVSQTVTNKTTFSKCINSTSKPRNLSAIEPNQSSSCSTQAPTSSKCVAGASKEETKTSVVSSESPFSRMQISSPPLEKHGPNPQASTSKFVPDKQNSSRTDVCSSSSQRAKRPRRSIKRSHQDTDRSNHTSKSPSPKRSKVSPGSPTQSSKIPSKPDSRKTLGLRKSSRVRNQPTIYPKSSDPKSSPKATSDNSESSSVSEAKLSESDSGPSGVTENVIKRPVPDLASSGVTENVDILPEPALASSGVTEKTVLSGREIQMISSSDTESIPSQPIRKSRRLSIIPKPNYAEDENSEISEKSSGNSLKMPAKHSSTKSSARSRKSSIAAFSESKSPTLENIMEVEVSENSSVSRKRKRNDISSDVSIFKSLSEMGTPQKARFLAYLSRSMGAQCSENGIIDEEMVGSWGVRRVFVLEQGDTIQATGILVATNTQTLTASALCYDQTVPSSIVRVLESAVQTRNA
eukprot:84176_1